MSELINNNLDRSDFRNYLLATACSLAFVTCTAAMDYADAATSDRPTVWIELGGQVELMGDAEEAYTPPFSSSFDHLHFDPVSPVQRPSRYAIGGEGTISFKPKNSDWVLSAGIRYGRSNGHKALYQVRAPMTIHVTKNGPAGQIYTYNVLPPYHVNATAANAEGHAILDFQAEKDVGLGVFSNRISSLLSIGVRFTQFTSTRKASLNGVPDQTDRGSGLKYGHYAAHHRYYGTSDLEHSFQGVGPSIAWKASTPLVRNDDSEGLSLDWGLNAAVLFGRQKVRGEHNETMLHYKTYGRLDFLHSINKFYNGVASSYHHPANLDRSHSAVVPNLGGFAGLSWRYDRAKVSLGYRADFFFGAMDGGIDTRKVYDRNFYGPFATISIGLGG